MVHVKDVLLRKSRSCSGSGFPLNHPLSCRTPFKKNLNAVLVDTRGSVMLMFKMMCLY